MLENLFKLEVGLIFFQTVSLVIVGFILKKYAWKSILTFIEKQEKEAKEALVNAQKAKVSLAKMQKMGEGIIERANKKYAEILDRATSTKEAILEEARLQANTEKERKLAEANDIITQKEMQLRQSLKGEVVALVLGVTQKVIGMQLAKQKQQEVYINQLIEETEKSLED